MADEQLAQSNAINTNQPTPLRGLVLRGHHPVETVNTELDGRSMIVNKADYDEKIHGKIVEAKLPTRKKKAKKKKASSEEDE